jgi:hypothetical protein
LFIQRTPATRKFDMSTEPVYDETLSHRPLASARLSLVVKKLFKLTARSGRISLWRHKRRGHQLDWLRESGIHSFECARSGSLDSTSCCSWNLPVLFDPRETGNWASFFSHPGHRSSNSKRLLETFVVIGGNWFEEIWCIRCRPIGDVPHYLLGQLG